MSEIKVNKISPRSGTDVTLGDSGDTFTLGSGANIAGLTLSDNILFDTASKGIYLGVTSATAANKLDDYEEGTWTPSWSFETSGSAVSTAYFGNYTKIGRIVHVSGGLLTSSISSPTGNAIIVTLPFQATTESNRDFAGSLTQVRRFASNMPYLRIEVSSGTSSLRFYDNTTSANNFAQLQGSDFETAASQNIVFFNVTYETD